ncbi:phage tail protein, partial [Pseudomonas aeruginosa]
LKAPLDSPKFSGTPESAGTMHVARAGGGLEVGGVDGTARPAYIDFHSGSVVTDYDARIISTGGNGSLAGATLTIQCGSLGLPENTRLPNPSAETMDDRVATTAFVHKVVGAGAVQLFARSTPPPGWLPANGAWVSRTTYAALFAAIGTTFGAGDGSTTFNLPDLRGEFLRGWDAGRGIDPGRSLGSSQEGALQAHTHSVPEGSSNVGATGYFSGYTS